MRMLERGEGGGRAEEELGEGRDGEGPLRSGGGGRLRGWAAWFGRLMAGCVWSSGVEYAEFRSSRCIDRG